MSGVSGASEAPSLPCSASARPDALPAGLAALFLQFAGLRHVRQAGGVDIGDLLAYLFRLGGRDLAVEAVDLTGDIHHDKGAAVALRQKVAAVLKGVLE